MERRSFLRREARAPCFQDVDLRAQPFLTKRGRAAKHIVKRVFVVLDDYLFYFHDADATEPCGVIPLANSQYVAHSYSATDQTDNYCYELRSPARAWGTVILHYHNCPPAKAVEVELLLETAGARRTEPAENAEQQAQPHSHDDNAQEDDHAPSDSKGKTKAKLSRLITLSGISSLALWPRRKAVAQGESTIPRRAPDTYSDKHWDPLVPSAQRIDQEEDTCLGESEKKTFIAKVKSGRHSSLLKIQLETTLSGDTSTTGTGGIAAQPSRRRSTLSFSCRGNWASRANLSDQRDIMAESEIAVEHCHELCVSGYVENTSRKLFHFISPYWAWEKLRRRRNSQISIVLDESDRHPRVRFASLLAASGCSGVNGAFEAATMFANGFRRLSSSSCGNVTGSTMAFVMRHGDQRLADFGFVTTRTRATSMPLLMLTNGSTVPSVTAMSSVAMDPVVTAPSLQVANDSGTIAAALSFQASEDSRSVGSGSRLLSTMGPLRDLMQHQDKQFAPSVSNKVTSVPLAPIRTHANPVSPVVSPTESTKPESTLPFSTSSRSGAFSSMRYPFMGGHANSTSCTVSPGLGTNSDAYLADSVRLVNKGLEARSASLTAIKISSSMNSDTNGPSITATSIATDPAPAAAIGRPNQRSTKSTPSFTQGKSTTDIRIVQAISVAESYSGGYLLKRYEPLKVIGTGGFGQVMVARHKSTGQLVAIKTLSKRALAQHHQVEHSLSEKAVLTLCRNHPFIVQLHAAFQTIDHLHLVLDYCPGGELFFHLSQRGRFQEHQAAFYLAEVLLAIEHLHRNNIIYRDLKPENVLLDQEGHVRLADFGLSKIGIDDQTLAMTFCGSIEYLAPEVLAMGKNSNAAASPTSQLPVLPAPRGYGRAADFWALGCLLFELLTGEPPFYSGNNRPKLYARIMNGQPSFPSYLSADAVDLISSLLRADPLERIGCRTTGSKRESSAAVRAHPFFAKHVNWDLVRSRRAKPPVLPRSDAFANFDKQFTSLPVRAVDKMVQFPSKIPMDYQLFENFNWEPSSSTCASNGHR